MKVRREPREASAFTKFRLLMWKNYLQQWRHPVQTVTEMLLPVATMALVLILRSQIEPSIRDVSSYPPIPAHSLQFSATVFTGMNRTHLAYYPESPVLEDVLRTSMVNLLTENSQILLSLILEYIKDQDIDLPDFPDLPDSSQLPDIDFNSTVIIGILKRLITVDGYTDKEAFRSIYGTEETTRIVLAAVEFNDELIGATELTQNLSYSLRFPERPRLNSLYGRGGRNWRTDLVFPAFELPGPRFPNSWEGGNDPGYVNEMFIALQHVISTELMSRVTGENLKNFNVFIQRYPHPAYMQDLAVDALQLLFPMFLMLSFSYTSVNIIRAVTVEKELQLKETMKIMGLPTYLHWLAWFCKQLIFLTIISILIVILVKVNWFSNADGFSEYAVFTSTPWTVLFFFLLLYLSCMIFFAFMVSGFFSKGSMAALFGGVIWFLTYVPAILISMDIEMSTAVQVITCLSINTAMAYGIQLILAKESSGGLQWSEFMESNSIDSNRFVFGHVIVMLAVDCVLYMLIALYLEQVFPGPFGAPKPWYFIVQKSFWFPNNKVGVEINDKLNCNIDVQEKDPVGLKAGVQMTNISKVYGNFTAVNNLSLNIYDDQITVLLGHNGAGKSTTISMLTGNTEVSSGQVYVAGYDMMNQTRKARSHIGLCTQHDVLFAELTVKEHLEFFARLKGYEGKELDDEIQSLIESLELSEKADCVSFGLSGGQKRRLCVGVALSGGARVVLLDEPTSGMDPASRRALWDLLQREKSGRSMILTTHFMDEADILGDRIAIMAEGRLQCVGSPYYLKKHYGVGYTLVVVKNPGFDAEACTDILRKHIADINIKEDRGSEVTYHLTTDNSHKFENMLNDLEKNIEIVQFKDYGLSATTLEDVFMSVGSDVLIDDYDDGAATTVTSSSHEDFDSLEELRTKPMSAFKRNILHVYAVWYKLWLVWTRSWGMLLLQILVPVLQINATLGILTYIISLAPDVIQRQLSLTNGFGPTETLLSFNGSDSSSFGALAKSAYLSLFQSYGNDEISLTDVGSQQIDNYYLSRTEDIYEMNRMRHEMLIGATFSDNEATAWFSNFGYHDVAITMATLHNAILKVFNSTVEMRVFNYPMEAYYSDQANLQLMLQLLSMQLSNGIGNSLAIVSSVFIIFYIKERVTRAKLLQKAAGIQPITMWLSAAVFDLAWFLIICVSIVISCIAFSVIGLSTAEELARLYVCLIVYGAAMLPINYLFSYCFNGPSVGFVIMFFVNILFGVIGPQIVEALKSPLLETGDIAMIMDYVLQFVPLYSLVTSIRTLNHIGLTLYTCMQACESLQTIRPSVTECTMEVMCDITVSCCQRDDPYFDWEDPGIARYLVAMSLSCVLLWSVFMFTEYRIHRKLISFFKQLLRIQPTLPPLDVNSLDSDVRDEMLHVQNTDPTNLSKYSLVAKGLTKFYGKNLAVNQVSFTVSDSECFGLLGVNGAGKTTTFKMLMGDEDTSNGDAFVSGWSVNTNITNVYENVGYCPQFDAIFPELTGRENLKLFSTLRGLEPASAARQAESLAESLSFTKHLDKRASAYSGGNRRKLSTAVALLGGSRLVFVDEPTTGVDPAAKRQVWRAIRRACRQKRGVVLTSHSMEECEALCSRLTIMVAGKFHCLGSPQHLKNKFSQGFTLAIKLRLDEDARDKTLKNQTSVAAVKNYVNANFAKPKLMEEYQGLITYYLPDRTMPWSRMFGIMETAKLSLEIEDYSISQTTLEQIFLQFTKYQNLGSKEIERNAWTEDEINLTSL